MQRRLTALGHLKSGQMNKTETAYAKTLEQQKRNGEIQAYWFEAIKLKIAEGTCWLTPDFMVLRSDRTLELHDVKGSFYVWQDDSKVKMKVCATNYPFRVLVVVPKNRKLNEWEIKEVI